MLSLLRPYYLRIMGWGSAALAVIGTLFMVRKSGKEAERNEANEKILENTEKAAAVETDTRRLSPDTVRERLRKRWRK